MLKRVSPVSEDGAMVRIADAKAPAPFVSGLEYGAPARGVWNIVHVGMLIPGAHEIYVCAGNCLRGVVCVEAGGPTPGLGCAGRGIIAALETLEEKGAYEAFRPDVVFYDVLGDVVCGGFSMPMRAGYADRVFIVTSGENMALHAAANIAMAVENFRGRGYASLGGLILNRRNVKNEEEKVVELAGDISSQIVGSLSLSDTVHQAEELSQTVIEAFPDSPMAAEYRALAENVLRACEVGVC